MSHTLLESNIAPKVCLPLPQVFRHLSLLQDGAPTGCNPVGAHLVVLGSRGIYGFHQSHQTIGSTFNHQG